MPPRPPIFLNLLVIRLPPAALVSILHRISGALMVISIPFAAWLSERALSGPEGFAEVLSILDRWAVRLMLVLALWALIHHLLAGIRHLALDLGWGLERPTAQFTARLTLWAVAVLLVAVLIAGVAA